MSDFRIGLYRHFKGNIYRVIGIATHTETGECLVLYKNAHHTGLTWARPLEMFMEKVNGKQRFEYLGNSLNPCEACPKIVRKADDKDCAQCSFF